MQLMKIHPRTGEPVLPLYMRHDGRFVWPVMGASPDDPNSGGTSGDGEPGGSGEGTGSTGEPAGGNEGGDADKPVSRAEFDKLQQHLSEADKKRTAAEAKLKEIEDGKKDELTKATEKVAELEKSLQARDSELVALRLDNAFLGVNDVTWHDKKVAMREAKAEGYLDEVVKDGKVDEKLLGKKLQELAKAKAYLVKSEGGQQQQTPPPSGGAVGSGGKGGKDGGTDEAVLKARYRSLNR